MNSPRRSPRLRALLSAIEQSDSDAIAAAIAQEGAPDELKHAFFYAAELGVLNALEQLLAAGVDVHTDYEEALLIAASYGKHDAMRFLLNAGADLQARPGDLYAYAANSGSVAAFMFLLGTGLTIPNPGKTACLVVLSESAATEAERLTLVRAIVDRYPPSAHYFFLVKHAAEKGLAHIAWFLIEQGAPRNHPAILLAAREHAQMRALYERLALEVRFEQDAEVSADAPIRALARLGPF